MGLDVYLRWDNISDDEKNKQYTGFSIEHGHVGYLRCCYGDNEIILLEIIFPDWKHLPQEISFDFVKNIHKKNYAIRQFRKKFFDEITEVTKVWMTSFEQFYILGLEKQRNGLKPIILFC